MAKKSLSGFDINAPLLLSGSAGTTGYVLASAGTTGTPTWSSIVIGSTTVFAGTASTSIAGLNSISASTITSTVATGTSPLTVTSTTLVTNLNADLLDGLHTATAATLNTVVARDANGSITANVVTANDILLGAGVAGQTQVSTGPVLIAKDTGSTYIQSALINSSTTGSADYAAYADNGSDTSGGWVDMGVTGSAFNDVNYTITGKNDGYVFANSVTGTGLTGNLVLATGSGGTTNDLVFGTGGFLAANEKMRFIHSTGQLDIETTTASTSTSTGALRVRGGAGIAGALFLGGAISGATGFTTAASNFTLATPAGGASASTSITITSGTSTAAATGAVTVTTGVTSGSAVATGALTLSTGTPTGTGTNSGILSIQTGNGSGSSGNSGNIGIDVGVPAGSGTRGVINIGTANALSINIGRTGATTAVTGSLSATTTVSGSTLTSTVATGTAPLTITSTTVVPNLTANAVGQSLILKADNGTTEGTDLYTFNGGTAKTLNIVGGANITVTKTSGQWSIALNQTNNGSQTFTNTVTFSNTGIVTLNGIVSVSNGAVPAGSTMVGTGDTASGLAYGTPNYLRWRTGVYYTVTGATASTFTGALTSIYMTPMYIPQKTTLLKIGINVATAGTTGALIKLGIYNNSTSATTGDVPTTLLLDAGTVAADTTGYKEITISQAINPGTYWLAYQMTVATSGITAVNPPYKDIAVLTANPTTFYSGYQVTTTSGAAFPAGPVTITAVPTSTAARIFLGT